MNYPRMPKKRPDLKKRRKKTKEEIDRQRDTTPGGPVEPDQDPRQKESGRNSEDR